MNIRALTAALATITAFALAACGSSGVAGSSPGRTPQANGSQPQGSADPNPASGQAKSANVCAVLPASAASQITGTTFTTAKSSSVEGVIFSCEYDGPDSALLQISVEAQDGKQSFDTDIAALTAVNHPPTRISGVGDEAFSEPDPHGNAGSVGASAFASYGAVFGATYIKIGGLTYVTADQGKQIVERLASKF